MRRSGQSINRRVTAILALVAVALTGFWIGYILKLARLAPLPGPSAEQPLVLAQFVDVGDGDAAIVSSPSGLLVLIDAGPDADGAAAVLTQLGRLHRHAPKIILLTSPRARSIGGAAYLITHCPFHGAVVLPSRPADFARTGGAAARDVLAAARSRGVRLLYWQQFSGQLEQTDKLADANVAAVPIPISRQTAADGEQALAIRLDLRGRYGSGSILYAAGLSSRDEDQLISQRAHLPCDILAAADGARSGSLSSEFLAEAGPENVVVSTSVAAPPDLAALERLSAADAVVQRTDRLGTVTLGLTGKPGAQVVYYGPGAPLPLSFTAPDEAYSSRARPS